MTMTMINDEMMMRRCELWSVCDWISHKGGVVDPMRVGGQAGRGSLGMSTCCMGRHVWVIQSRLNRTTVRNVRAQSLVCG